MSVVFKVFIGCAVFLLVPQAFAECPNGAKNIAAQAVYDVEQKRTTATEASPNLVLLAEKCKDDGTVQLKATEMMLKVHDETKDAKSRYQIVEQAWKYLTVYSELPPHFLPRVVVDGQVFSQSSDTAKNIRKAALNGLLFYDALDVGHHPYLASSPAFFACPKSTSISDSITIKEWTQKRGAQDDGKDTGAMRLLGRLVVACQNEPAPLYRSPARYRAQIQMAMAERMEDKALALKFAQQARADINIYLAGEKTARFWQKIEADKLSALLARLADDNYQFNNMPPIPREDWFKQENLGSEAVIMAIGFAFDEKWSLQVGAATVAEGYQESLLAVGKELGVIFSLATKSGHEAKGRNMMYQALKRHADGRYRRPETVDLKPIPDHMWTWLKKDAD